MKTFNVLKLSVWLIAGVAACLAGCGKSHSAANVPPIGSNR